MTNRECARTSALSVKSNTWLSSTGQQNNILNEIYLEMKRFGFANYTTIDSL